MEALNKIALKKYLYFTALLLFSCQQRTLNEFDYDKTIKIEYSNKQLKEIPTDIGEYKNVEVINFSFNDLNEISEDICSLNNLKALYLTENNITMLPNCLYDMKNLQELGLTDNKLKFLDKDFEKLKLSKLQLSNNKFIDVGDEIFKINPYNLSFLDLRNNPFRKNLSLINRFSNLSQINIENCSIENQINISNLSKLEIFNANHNKLKDFPNGISNSKGLKEIYLRENIIEILNDSVNFLVSLEVLDLSNNRLKSLPNLKQLKNLTTLSLANNDFNSFPKELLELGGLKELNFSFNKINSIPNDIYKMRNLRVIYLIKCGLNEAEINKISKLLPNTDIRL
jgi:leucine-rich repeat protein SHOC2